MAAEKRGLTSRVIRLGNLDAPETAISPPSSRGVFGRGYHWPYGADCGLQLLYGEGIVRGGLLRKIPSRVLPLLLVLALARGEISGKATPYTRRGGTGGRVGAMGPARSWGEGGKGGGGR